MTEPTSMWRYVYRNLRQSLCPHRCRIGDIKRLGPERVECPCLRCGKVLSAPYGLALDAREWSQ